MWTILLLSYMRTASITIILRLSYFTTISFFFFVLLTYCTILFVALKDVRHARVRVRASRWVGSALILFHLPRDVTVASVVPSLFFFCYLWLWYDMHTTTDIDDAAKEIVYRNYVDISVAVSSPNGLVVPVLRNVEDMGESLNVFFTLLSEVKKKKKKSKNARPIPRRLKQTCCSAQLREGHPQKWDEVCRFLECVVFARSKITCVTAVTSMRFKESICIIAPPPHAQLSMDAVFPLYFPV